MRSPKRRSRVIGGVVGLALLAVGALFVAGTRDEAPEEAAAPAGRSPAANAPDTAGSPDPPAPTPPEVTPTPGSSPPTSAPGALHPTPQPAPGRPPAAAPPLVGHAHRIDADGDLVDSAGREPTPPAPAADLTAVTLEGDGTELAITFTLSGRAPDPGRMLLWSLDMWVDDALVHTVTVQQDGSRLVAGALDWETGAQQPLDDVTAGSRALTVRVPANALPHVDGPFEWQALGQADGGYEDTTPDTQRAWFPDDD